jgi:hypothetical protein
MKVIGDFFPSRKHVSDDGVIHVIVDVPRGYNITPETGKRTYIHNKGSIQVNGKALVSVLNERLGI